MCCDDPKKMHGKLYGPANNACYCNTQTYCAYYCGGSGTHPLENSRWTKSFSLRNEIF